MGKTVKRYHVKELLIYEVFAYGPQDAVNRVIRNASRDEWCIAVEERYAEQQVPTYQSDPVEAEEKANAHLQATASAVKRMIKR